MNDAPIGIFDSGVGGLTVARAVLDQLPHEPVLYVGDTAHGPYGPLPIATVGRTRWTGSTTWSTRASRCW
jgi:glutamate racemase